MPQPSPGQSELDARLAEIDRRLREIQADLVPDREPSPPAAIDTGGRRRIPPAGQPSSTVDVAGPPAREASPPTDEPDRAVDEPSSVPEVPDREPRLPSGDQIAVARGPGASAGEAGQQAEDASRPAEDPSRPGDEVDPSGDDADAKTAAAAPAEDYAEQRGRAGPLAALLQRSRRRRDPPEGQAQADLAALAQMHDQVLGAMRELIEAYGVTLRRLSQEDAVPPLEVELSAGPFASTEAVHRFVAELSGLESVREVIVRGYEGENRALLELQLVTPSA